MVWSCFGKLVGRPRQPDDPPGRPYGRIFAGWGEGKQILQLFANGKAILFEFALKALVIKAEQEAPDILSSVDPNRRGDPVGRPPLVWSGFRKIVGRSR